MLIFRNQRDYKRFLKSMLYYQIKGPKPRFSLFAPTTSQLDTSNKIIDIICYCLMPTHFHFLIKQVENQGVTEFVGKLSNSYTKYFNIKGGRVGPLLQGEFKSVLIESDEQLLHVSRYIHLNPIVSDVANTIGSYTWSSYGEYIGTGEEGICSKDIILGQFKSCKDYQRFVSDQESYGRDIELIKHHLLD